MSKSQTEVVATQNFVAGYITGAMNAVMVMALVLSSGCTTTPRPSPVLKPGVIQEQAKSIQDTNAKISDNAVGIIDDAVAAIELCPDVPQLPAIQEKAETIIQLTWLITERTTELTAIGKQVDTLSGDLAKSKQENIKLKEKIASGERTFLLWLFGIGTVIIIGGVVLAIFVSPRVMGLAVIALGLVCITVAKVLLSYAGYVYGGVGLIVLGTLGYLAYKHFVLDKRVIPHAEGVIAGHERILNQVLDTVDKMKGLTTTEQFRAIAEQTQDGDVQRFINNLRTTIANGKIA